MLHCILLVKCPLIAKFFKMAMASESSWVWRIMQLLCWPCFSLEIIEISPVYSSIYLDSYLYCGMLKNCSVKKTIYAREKKQWCACILFLSIHSWSCQITDKGSFCVILMFAAMCPVLLVYVLKTAMLVKTTILCQTCWKIVQWVMLIHCFARG